MKRRLFEEEPEHQDRWLVSYADFITLMFAFFVVMYASSSINLSKYSQLSDSMLSAFSQNGVKTDSKSSNTTASVAIPLHIATSTEQAAQQNFAQSDPQEDKLHSMQFAIDELVQTQQSLESSLLNQKNIQHTLQTSFDERLQKNANLQTAFDELNKKVKQTNAMNKFLTSANNDRNHLLESIRSSLFSEGIQVEIDIENGILRLPETLLFDSGKADFRTGGAGALKLVAQNLMKILPCYSGAKSDSKVVDECAINNLRLRQLEAIFIEGHTDTVPISNSAFKDNWDLSIARAKNTYLELIKATPELEKIQNKNKQPLLSFSAYAGRRPIAENIAETDRRKNRRIDLRFIMEPPILISTVQEVEQEPSEQPIQKGNEPVNQ